MKAKSAAFLLFTIRPSLAPVLFFRQPLLSAASLYPTPLPLLHAPTHTNWTAFSALEEVEHMHRELGLHTHTHTHLLIRVRRAREPARVAILIAISALPLTRVLVVVPRQPQFLSPAPLLVLSRSILRASSIIGSRHRSLSSPTGTAMATATSEFTEFAREWGDLLAKDSSASMDHLFSTYARLKGANEVASSSSSEGSGEPPFGSPVASIEDFTDVWAAAKRVHKEWEATCMVRSIRHSIGGSVTQTRLMLSMLCWAALLRQEEQKFFKEFLAQVREIIHCAALRCTASGYGEDSESIYEEVAFCVALELLGWHDSLLICLQRAMASPPPLRSEDDVLLFTRKVAQQLVSALSPRQYSTDDMPVITITRSSATSNSLEHELPAPTAEGDIRTEAMAGDRVVVISPMRSPSKECVSSSSRYRDEHAHTQPDAVPRSSPSQSPPPSPPLPGILQTPENRGRLLATR